MHQSSRWILDRINKSKWIKSKKKGKIKELTDLRRQPFGARAMLDSPLTPKRDTPKLLLKHQSLYKWITYSKVCAFQWRAWGRRVFIVPQGWFLSLAVTFSWQKKADWPPRGRPAMVLAQTSHVKLVLPLPSSCKSMRQGPHALAPKWGRLARVGSTDHLLCPPGPALVLPSMYIDEFPL
jgi:hypothetical protein